MLSRLFPAPWVTLPALIGPCAPVTRMFTGCRDAPRRVPSRRRVGFAGVWVFRGVTQAPLSWQGAGRRRVRGPRLQGSLGYP